MLLPAYFGTARRVSVLSLLLPQQHRTSRITAAHQL